ncbi:sugar transport system (sugar-binding protein) [Oceanicola granulosus HTCC2516]|uniref:Sugar transport system (Sugar-binding protein) n=1 Tax=Oceanicola granulosus (strain ATCC BAA-861 / DSM 15982 / KCTC 12143 / HTCC2516) TaxID=314256 RepID=Q2CGR6_OCEGH|nr:sugar ABC transporter substrate-binding protein [Oceanicola granulosus]EAR51869.1 sugar transport system (sugar-binding protein) [Oceanicola granulosus HTCC2516]
MKTIKTLASAGLVAALAATGAAAQEVNTEVSGEISVWTWPNNDRTFEALMPAFNEVYPNVTVDVQGYPSGNNVYLNTLQRALMSNSGPDVAMIEIGMIAQLRDRDQFADLRDAPFNAGAMADQFTDFAWENVLGADGQVAAVPKHIGPGGLFYRADIWEEAGYDTDPEAMAELLSDWDALLEAGKQVAAPNERWIIGSGEEIVRSYLAQNGLSYFSEDGTHNFDHPVMIEAFDLVGEFAEADLISPFSAWTPEWQGAFARGQFASVIYGNWMGGLLKRAYSTEDAGKWRVTFAPAAPNGVRAFNMGGDYMAVLAGTDNPEAAWAFVTFVVSDPASLEQQYQQDDLYPAFAPATESDWINFADPYYGGQNVNEFFAEVQEKLVPLTLHPLDSIAQSAMQTAVDNVVRGVMSPQEALAQAKEQVEARL